ncbi:hypothetical protein [Devosia aquimaris]|uniref:hypothetical protein n=1 Tax=Devosia aquimaris TaxID=2866214 RepID=UPI001CD157C8|nr:hypothetical protein [Devosia sp. CJK-A8-3]
MFHLTRRIMAGLPMAPVLLGLGDQPGLLAVPPALTALVVLLRDRQIRRRVGLAAWPSDGFARHVLVDDLAKLLGHSLLALPLFLIGHALRATLLPV